MILTFRELKPIIAKSCKSGNSDLSNMRSMHHFTVDCEELEENLVGENTNLHVLSFRNKIESHKPKLEDIQLLSEYIYIQEKTSERLLNDVTEYVTLMLYSDMGGELWRKVNKEELINSDVDLFKKVNIDEDMSIIRNVIDFAPIYGISITKRFNPLKERFDYNINFKSNQAMNEYVKSYLLTESENN